MPSPQVNLTQFLVEVIVSNTAQYPSNPTTPPQTQPTGDSGNTVNPSGCTDVPLRY